MPPILVFLSGPFPFESIRILTVFYLPSISSGLSPFLCPPTEPVQGPTGPNVEIAETPSCESMDSCLGDGLAGRVMELTKEWFQAGVGRVIFAVSDSLPRMATRAGSAEFAAAPLLAIPFF